MHNYAVAKSRKNKPFLVVLAVRVRVGFVYLYMAKVTKNRAVKLSPQIVLQLTAVAHCNGYIRQYMPNLR